MSRHGGLPGDSDDVGYSVESDDAVDSAGAARTVDIGGECRMNGVRYRPYRRRRSMFGPALMVFGVVLVLVGCTNSAPPARSLSAAEAARLAGVRFENYAAGVVSFAGAIPSAAGTLRLAGRLDFAHDVGYGTLTTDGRDLTGSSGVIEWSPVALAFLPSARPIATDPPPAGEWQLRALQATGGELDAPLRLLLDLGSGHPDNAQLLRHSSAEWLRADSVHGTPVDVFAGPTTPGPQPVGPTGSPSRLHYWVDDTAHLLRLQAWFGATGDDLQQQAPAEFDFTPGGAPVTVLPQLPTGGS